MSVAYLVSIMTGVNHSIPTLDPMIFSTLIIYSQRLRKGMSIIAIEKWSTKKPPDSSDLANIIVDLLLRCNIVAVIAEVDRIMRPEGYLIVRDTVESTSEVESIAKSLHWDIRFTYSKGSEGLLCIQKTFWRPTKTQTIVSAIA